MSTPKPEVAARYQCAKCGHEWRSDKPWGEKPKLCPSCRTRRWEAPGPGRWPKNPTGGEPKDGETK